MKDEFGGPFGKKEFLETFIVVVVTLFVVGIGFSMPTLFPLILLVLMVALTAVLITGLIKRKKPRKP